MQEPTSLRSLLERDPRLQVQRDATSGVVRTLRGNLARVTGKGSRALRSAGLRFMEAHPDLFGNIDTRGLQVLQEAPDPQGGLSLTLQQHHGRYPVYGGSIRFHVLSDGTLDLVSNALFADLADVSAQPKTSERDAVSAAQRATKCESPPARSPEVVVYRHEGRARLAWRINLNDTKPGPRGIPPMWVVYVDADSAAIIVSYDNVQTAGPAVGSGTGYYSGTGPLNSWFTNLTYQLRDTTRTAAGGPEIVTADEDGANPSEDPDNNWNDSTSTPRDQNQGPEVDAHRFAANVADYFSTVHGRNSYDGAGGNFLTVVHYGTNVSNGFWDGSKVNLGDGSGVAPSDDYECSDDWLGHEFTHGYTQFTCGLQYLNEAGALNEAFSDIFAAFITGDWLVFEDTWQNPSAPAWRNMMDPTNGGQWNPADPINSVFAGHQPSHYSVRYTGTWDNGGVHVNSGIINNLFYLLTVGGTHTVSGITVAGIGQSAAEQLLFRCMSVSLVGKPNASFIQFREEMLDACLDLFPTDLVKLSQVKNAFNAVGIGPDIYVRDNLADSGAEPFPGAYLWASPDIINRTTAVTNPATAFSDLTNDSLWQNVEFGQDNFVYVRLQNRGSAAGDATVSVFFSPASTFPTPASWIFIGTMAALGIAPGSMRVGGPLTFPSALVPSPGHYCMIAVVTSPLDPAPDTALISTLADYLSFVRNTNNIAYRNMDVVNLVPGTPGTLAVQVGNLKGIRDRFDVHVDLRRFVPGARVVVHGPAKILDGAIPRGLKIAARKEGQNLYDVLPFREQLKRFGLAHGLVGPLDLVYGFDNVLVEEPFTLRIDYLLPKEVGRARGRRLEYLLAVQQLWQGEVIGAMGLVFRTPQSERPERSTRSRRRRPEEVFAAP